MSLLEDVLGIKRPSLESLFGIKKPGLREILGLGTANSTPAGFVEPKTAPTMRFPVEMDKTTTSLFNKPDFANLEAQKNPYSVITNQGQIATQFPGKKVSMIDPTAAVGSLKNVSRGVGKKLLSKSDPLIQEAKKYGGWFNEDKITNARKSGEQLYVRDLITNKTPSVYKKAGDIPVNYTYSSAPSTAGQPFLARLVVEKGTDRARIEINTFYPHKNDVPALLQQALGEEVEHALNFKGNSKMMMKDYASSKYSDYVGDPREIAANANLRKRLKSKPLQDPLIQEARKYKSAEEFVKAQPVKSEALEGAMSHRLTRTGATADNISQEVSDMGIPDFYEHPEWYHYGGKEYDESVEALKKIKGKPDAEVIIYRASPKNELRNGDWVTLSKEKARLESLSEKTKVQSFKVRVKDLEFAGDDITEFGYWGHSTKDKSQLTDIWNKANKKRD